MERHIRILAMLSRLWGALALVIGTSMLLLAGGASAIVAAPSRAAVGVAAYVTAAVFVVAGLLALVWGGASLWSGVLLRRRQPFGRVLALGLGLVNLPVLPFGTAFGIYAFWVLLADEGRRAFNVH